MSTRSALDDPSEIITAGFYFITQGCLILLLTLDSKWELQQFSPCCWNTALLMCDVPRKPYQADSELGVNLVQLHLHAPHYKKMPGSSATWSDVLSRCLSMKKSKEENRLFQICSLCVDSFICSQTNFFSPSVANEHLRIWFSSLEWLPLTARMLICLNPFSSTYLEVNHLEPAFQRGAG